MENFGIFLGFHPMFSPKTKGLFAFYEKRH